MRRSPMIAAAVVALAFSTVQAATLRWASQGDYLTADPMAQNELLTNSINGHVYESLVVREMTRAGRPHAAYAVAGVAAHSLASSNGSAAVSSASRAPVAEADEDASDDELLLADETAAPATGSKLADVAKRAYLRENVLKVFRFD